MVDHDYDETEPSYTALRELIESGELLPNSQYRTDVLAARIAATSTEIRTAAHRLRHEGLVELNSFGDICVRPIDSATVTNLYSQLGELEGRAAFVAAKYGTSLLNMRALDDGVRLMEDARHRRSALRWTKASYHFHRSLVMASEDQRLIAAALPLSERAFRTQMVCVNLPQPRLCTGVDHLDIVDAIRSGRSHTAQDIVERAWEQEASTTLALLRVNRLDESALN